jgi:hypothetical protein
VHPDLVETRNKTGRIRFDIGVPLASRRIIGWHCQSFTGGDWPEHFTGQSELGGSAKSSPNERRASILGLAA